MDDDVYELVKDYKWHCTTEGYAIRNLPREYRQLQKKVRLHQVVMGMPDSSIDHIDGDKLNNQRSNLRLCTTAQNGANRKMSIKNTSGLRGVSFNKNENKWEVRFGKFYLGRYFDKIEAAKIYDKKALEIAGEFAKTNF